MQVRLINAGNYVIERHNDNAFAYAQPHERTMVLPVSTIADYIASERIKTIFAIVRNLLCGLLS